MTVTRAKSPRFRRTDERPKLQLTADDLEVLWQLYRHRVMDSQSIYSLFPTRSAEKISKRLRRLWLAEYVERMDRDNMRLRQRNGSDHFVYALAREGGKVLQAQNAPEFDPYRLTQKNRKLHPLTIEHLLQTTRFMVSLRNAARDHGEARVVHFDELRHEFPKAERRKSGLPLALRAEVEWQGIRSEQGTAPDQIFSLELPNERQFIFLEIDQGTETIEPGIRQQQSPSFWNSSSILRKMLVYAHAFRQGAHQEQYGLPVFRVLTVTTSPKRVEAMRQLYADHLRKPPHSAKPGLFLFTDWKTIGEHEGSILNLPLQRASGNDVALSL